MVVHNPDPGGFEYVELRCACGTGINGAVLAGRTESASSLFRAHHAGPSCEPSSQVRPITRSAGSNTVLPRLTAERICRSAWWVRRDDVPERGVVGR